MNRIPDGPRATMSRRGSGLFRRTYEAMMGARERQANRIVAQHLLALDDEALDRLGYDRRTLEAQGFRQPF